MFASERFGSVRQVPRKPERMKCLQGGGWEGGDDSGMGSYDAGSGVFTADGGQSLQGKADGFTWRLLSKRLCGSLGSHPPSLAPQ